MRHWPGRAQRSTGVGGLGLRSTAQHADTAFVSSSLSTASLQIDICPALSHEDALTEPFLLAAVQSLSLLECWQQAIGDRLLVSQKSVSRLIDRSAFGADLQNASASLDSKAHLQLCAAAWADAWVQAHPNKDLGTQMDSERLRIALGRRLRLPLLDQPSTCKMCGANFDRFLDHAMVCGC